MGVIVMPLTRIEEENFTIFEKITTTYLFLRKQWD
jgi:hypothetical protein